MRCAPLACLGSGGELDLKAIMADVFLTNPSTINYWCEYLYLKAIRMALVGYKVGLIWEYILKSKEPAPPVVSYVFELILKDETPPMTTTNEGKNVKGWVINAFYTAMRCLYLLAHSKKTYHELIEWVIGLWGDTDTNASISGNLIGAIIGYEVLTSSEIINENIKIMVHATSHPESSFLRPREYQLVDFMEIADGLYKLGTE